jgi:hypothetical protein
VFFFGFSYRNFGFSNQNFGFLNQNFGFSYPKLRVYENRSFVFLKQSCSFCKEFFSSYRNFKISNPYKVSNEVSVERKAEKFTKFRAKINYCVEEEVTGIK